MTATITSPQNPRLKDLRRLRRSRERARTGLFFVEGEDLVAAARAAGRDPLEGFRALGVDVGEPGFHEVDPAVLAAVSELGSGTRAIGVYRQSWSAPSGPLCVYLHGVHDPGNVGTIVSSAVAFGATCVALGPGCADPHSPRAVRASMGAVFAASLASVGDVGELPGMRVALVAGSGRPIRELGELVSEGRGGAAERPSGGEDRRGGGLTLLVGAERDGLPSELVDACELVAHIPILTDSLNAAQAATVALYETTRDSTRVSAS